MKNKGYVLVVKDVEVSKRFHQDVTGATVQLDLGGYVVFEEGFFLLDEATWKELNEDCQLAVTYSHNAGEMYFEEDELDAFLSKLGTYNGIRMFSSLKETAWGQRTVKFRDPDGHLVEVGESMELVVKRVLLSGLSVEEAARKSMFSLEVVKKCLAEIQEQDKPAEGQ